MNWLYTGALGLVVATFVFTSAPARADLQSDIDQSVTILERLPAGAIPASVVEKAYGLAIFNVVKAAAVFSLGGGKGVLVARTDDGWSGPVGIGGGGVGFGLQIGLKVTELVFVLNTPKAVEAFSKGNFKLGADLSVAFFPWGRTATGGLTPEAAVYGYGDSQGLFAGVSLEGRFIGVRDKDNTAYYGEPVVPMSVLRGEVAAPAGAAKLHELLAKY